MSLRDTVDLVWASRDSAGSGATEEAHHARWDRSGVAGGWWPRGPSRARPPGPTSGASHLLPECTVATVVGLGLRSAPTPETPDAEDTKLQSVEDVRPAGVSGHRKFKALDLPVPAVGVTVQPDATHGRFL